jgi:hypothetical protein
MTGETSKARVAGPRVVLVTASGHGGQVDVGVRSDATPADLASALASAIGVGTGPAVVEHHAPPRPGVPQGTRVRMDAYTSLADSGVADGDLITFRTPGEAAGKRRPNR